MKFYDMICKGSPPEGFEKASKEIKPCRGGTLEQNRELVKKGCPVLLDPVSLGKQSVDTALLQIANDNDVTIGISHRQFLLADGARRARLLAAYQKLVLLCMRKKCRILIVSGAENEMEKRQPMQLVALAVLLGMSPEQAKWSISKVPEYLMEARVE